MKKFSKKFNKNAFRLTFLHVLLLSVLMAGLTLKTGLLGGSFQDNSKDDELGFQIKTSGSWNLTGTPIFIDGDATGVDAHNWTWATNQPWCSGDGSWGTPYLLENITIDGEGSGNCIEIRDSQNKYIRIKNCTVYNGDTGIKLLNVNNATLMNNTCNENDDRGIFLDTCINNSILDNNASKSKAAFSRGAYLLDSLNITIYNNTFNENYVGIYGKNLNWTMMKQNNITSNVFAIVLERCYNCEVRQNIMFYNGISVFYSYTSNTIDKSNLVNDKPVYYYTNEVGLRNVNLTNAGQVFLHNCNDSVISDLNISRVTHGIELHYCINVSVSRCNISFNKRYGIHLFYSMNNSIQNNVLFNNSQLGIFARGNYNNITYNNASFNGETGIMIVDLYNYAFKNNCSYNLKDGININGKNNTFKENIVSFNKERGFFGNSCSNNTLLMNSIDSNTLIGIYFQSPTGDNKIFQNYFKGNALHAQDDGTDNLWDNGAIGNYWDNYTGSDPDDDYIGDIPYTFIAGIAGSIDNKPIWDDGDDTNPGLEIILPNADDYFGPGAPNFSIEVSDKGGMHTKWYTMDGGSVNITFSVNGTIDQGNWSLLSDGPVTLTFYVNDTSGNVNTSSVNVNKDSVSPTINIISPIPNSLFGIKNAPNFTVEINDTNLDEMWYELPGGINRTFTYNTTFNAVEWSALPNGTNIIWFHANDTAGNVASSSISVRIDGYVPKITIVLPLMNSVHDSAPEMRIIAFDSNIDIIWYNVTGNATKVDITGANDTLINLNSFIWSSLPEGMFQVSFFANDTTGNINNTFIITLYKDTIAPNILINGPTNQSYWNSAPSINITIFEANFNETWATCNGQKITLINNTDVSLSAAWAGLSQGSFQVFIHANDSAGNINDTLVLTLYKDTIKPNITIIQPTGGQQFSRTTPSFIIEVNSTDIDKMWYSLDGGLNNYTFTVNGSFNDAAWQARWDALPNQSIITITFHVNDSANNINSSSVQVIVNKTNAVPPPTTTTTTTTTTPAEEFDILEFFTSPIGLMTIGTLVGAIALIIIMKSKGGKSSKKERGKIDEIVKNL